MRICRFVTQKFRLSVFRHRCFEICVTAINTIVVRIVIVHFIEIAMDVSSFVCESC